MHARLKLRAVTYNSTLNILLLVHILNRHAAFAQNKKDKQNTRKNQWGTTLICPQLTREAIHRIVRRLVHRMRRSLRERPRTGSLEADWHCIKMALESGLHKFLQEPQCLRKADNPMYHKTNPGFHLKICIFFFVTSGTEVCLFYCYDTTEGEDTGVVGTGRSDRHSGVHEFSSSDQTYEFKFKKKYDEKACKTAMWKSMVVWLGIRSSYSESRLEPRFGAGKQSNRIFIRSTKIPRLLEFASEENRFAYAQRINYLQARVAWIDSHARAALAC